MLLASVCLPTFAQRLATTTLTLAVGARCGVSVLSSEVSSGDSNDYNGTISFLYFVRTSTSAGTGNIQLELVEGSRKGNALTSGVATLGYTTELSGVGMANSGQQTISSAATDATVVSFGADQHSPRQGSTGTINWSVHNNASSEPPTLRLNMACR